MNEVIIIVNFEQQEVIANYSLNFSGPYIVVGNVTCEITGYKAEEKSAKINLEVFDERDWGPGISPFKFTLRNGEFKLVNISFSVPYDEDNRTRNKILVNGEWVLYPNIRDTHAKGEVQSGSFEAIVNRKSAVRHPTSGLESDDPIDEIKPFLEAEGALILISIIAIPMVIIILLIYRRKQIKEIRRLNEIINREEINKQNKVL